MRVKAKSDFSGIPYSMTAGSVLDIPLGKTLDALLAAGLVEPVADKADEVKVRRKRNEGKRSNG